MIKNFAAIIAGTVIALAAAPAGATHLGEPSGTGPTVTVILNSLAPTTIFVTSLSYTGNLVEEANASLSTNFQPSQGLRAADALCQRRADATIGTLPAGEWVALISSDVKNASARIHPSNGPYIRADGAPIAADWATLFSTHVTAGGETVWPLLNAVNIDENGDFHGGLVWTGTIASGVSSGVNCAGWASDNVLDFGTTGISSAVNHDWLDGAESNCEDLNALYCVQQ